MKGFKGREREGGVLVIGIGFVRLFVVLVC